MTAPYTWRNLATPEQFSMLLDGQLWRTGPVLHEPDCPDDTNWRAHEASIDCPPNVVLVRLSAAWIWKCLDAPPARWQVTSVDRSRLQTMPHARFAVCDLKLEPQDVLRLRNSRVTSPGRTAIDIARYEERLLENDIARLLRDLLIIHGTTFGKVDEIISRVEDAQHLPYKRRCLERIARAGRLDEPV